MAAVAEARSLKDVEKGEAAASSEERVSWPAISAPAERKARHFCAGTACGGCCPPYWALVPLLGLLGYACGVAAAALACAAALAAVVLVSLPGCLAYAWFSFWRCSPFEWLTDTYTKVMFLAVQSSRLSHKMPTAGPEDMPISGLKPKKKLDKHYLDYALNLKVPTILEEEFVDYSSFGDRVGSVIEENLALLPQFDYFEGFSEGEDPVAYAMRQLGNIYPEIHQVWDDKLSDRALARFCLFGLGAHRVETVDEGGSRRFVVRADALAGLPVRDGFARYGGDAYFDENWMPLKIVDSGLLPISEDGSDCAVTVRPGDRGWEQAKFRFRSSLSVLATLVDHLYGVHLQMTNLMITALREQLSPEHPLRRFLTPFTYKTITVNVNARNNLVQPRSLGPRCFSFSDRGLQLAFAAAPRLLREGFEVSQADGGPILNRADYVDYLREKRGIDTEYFRQSKRYWLILRRFVVDYLACYYPTPAAVVEDPELSAAMRQFSYQVEFIAPCDVLPDRRCGDPEVTYGKIVDTVTNFMYAATAGHEQVGAVEAYVQDVSFCAFKWVPGALAGTKQTATAQALLMASTGKAMPKVLDSDWTHLFPAPSAPPSQPAPELVPEQVFRTFQDELRAFSKDCDNYNEATQTRPFPECFPLYVMNPKLLETSCAL